MAWVYILKTGQGNYYVGSTTDLERRIAQHISGHTKTTKRLQVESVVFNQQYKSLKEARAVEARIKKLKRRDYVEKIIQDGYIKMTLK